MAGLARSGTGRAVGERQEQRQEADPVGDEVEAQGVGQHGGQEIVAGCARPPVRRRGSAAAARGRRRARARAPRRPRAASPRAAVRRRRSTRAVRPGARRRPAWRRGRAPRAARRRRAAARAGRARGRCASPRGGRPSRRSAQDVVAADHARARASRRRASAADRGDEARHGVMQPALHRASGEAEDLGHLVLREVVVVAQHDGAALRLGAARRGAAAHRRRRRTRAGAPAGERQLARARGDRAAAGGASRGRS